jgi:putative ABC transport system permease protein
VEHARGQSIAGTVSEGHRRRKNTVGPEQVANDLHSLTLSEAQQYPDGDFRNTLAVRSETLHEFAFGSARSAVSLMTALAGVILVLTMFSAATLLMVHTIDRRRELGVRSAVGATPARLFRQLLTEGVVLSTIAALIGLAILGSLQSLLRTLTPATFPRAQDVGIDWWVLAWTVSVVMITGISATLGPGWVGARAAGGWKGSDTATGSAPAHRLRRALLIAQMLVIVPLIGASTLLLHSPANVRGVPLGFEPSGVFTAEIQLTNPTYREPGTSAAFERELLDRLRSLPFVDSASVTSAMPFSGRDGTGGVRSPAGGTTEATWTVNRRQVDAQYFSLMRVPVFQGRGFGAEDTASAPPVAVLSASFARAFFGDQDPVGRTINDGIERRVIGVVGDVRHVRVEDAPMPAYYLPRAQVPSAFVEVLVRPPLSSPADVNAALRQIVHSIDPSQPIQRAAMLEDVISQSLAERTFYTIGATAFCLLALIVAISAMYGTAAQSGVVTSARDERSVGTRRRRQQRGATHGLAHRAPRLRGVAARARGKCLGDWFVAWLSVRGERW